MYYPGPGYFLAFFSVNPRNPPNSFLVPIEIPFLEVISNSYYPGPGTSLIERLSPSLVLVPMLKAGVFSYLLVKAHGSYAPGPGVTFLDIPIF